MATLDQLIAKEIVVARLDGRSFYFEMTCQNEGSISFGGTHPACGQRFQFPRGMGSSPLCPRCGWVQFVSKENGLVEAISGIPVD